MKYIRIYLAILILNLLLFSLVFKQFPNYRNYIFSEDRLVENLSCFFYLVSFFLGVTFLSKGKTNKSKGKTHKIIFPLISALGLICFLDELSFGERIFSLTMPRIGEVKIDAVHDLFDLTFQIAKKSVFLHSIFNHLSVGIILGTVITSFVYRSKVVNLIDKISRHPHYTFLLIFAGLAFFAVILDLHLVKYKPEFMSVLEEVFEMNASIALCFFWLSLLKANVNLHSKP